MTNPIFRFLPGEKVLWIVGMPGPETDECEIISDDGGEKVRIRFQVWGEGQFHEKDVARGIIVWNKWTETSMRFHHWKTGNHHLNTA